MIFMICVNLLRAASVHGGRPTFVGFSVTAKMGFIHTAGAFITDTYSSSPISGCQRGARRPMAHGGAPWAIGWVRETLDHDYADAQRRGHPVTLLVTETTGALSPIRPRLASAW